MLSTTLFSSSAISNIGFDDILFAHKHKQRYIFINTMSSDMQNALIPNTIPCGEEVNVINDIIDEYNTNKYTIIVYGKNSCDETTHKKYHQLRQLGFSDIHIYPGGMFEYMLLNDMYGEISFPISGSTGKGVPEQSVDILKYRSTPSVLNKTL